MFQTLHRRDPTSRQSASPGVTDAMCRDTARTTVPAETRKPRAALRHLARNVTNEGRIGGMWRRLVPMLGAACVLVGSSAMAADNGSPAQNLVMQVTSSVIEVLDSERELLDDNRERVYELADRMVLPYFDFERMARRVLGKRWKKATAEQQTRFVSAFRTLLVRTYSIVLNEYRGQSLTYLDPVPRENETEVVIPVDVELTGAQSVRVAYAMHGSGSDWKVFDVAVDGVSLVTNYRSSFRSEIARHGIDGLIARIEARNSKAN